MIVFFISERNQQQCWVFSSLFFSVFPVSSFSRFVRLLNSTSLCRRRCCSSTVSRLVCSSLASLSEKPLPVLPRMIIPTKTAVDLQLWKERKKKSQHRNQAAGEESRLMGDSGHAFSRKVTWQTNGSPVPLMHPIIIASDFHLPFSLFQKLPINLALKEFPPSLAATRVSITLVAAQNNTSRNRL